MFNVKKAVGVGVIGAALVLLVVVAPRCMRLQAYTMNYQLRSPQDVVTLFPSNTDQVARMVQTAKREAQEEINKINALPSDSRSFETVARALDTITMKLHTAHALCGVLGLLHKDDAMRDACNKGMLELSNFMVDSIGQNEALYKAFKEYAQTKSLTENLDDSSRYFISENLSEWKRAGLELPLEQREKVKALQKELAALSIEFDDATNRDASCIVVTRQELAGLEDDFINNLKQLPDGKISVGVDYPTYFAVMEHCTNQETRKKLSRAFGNRAYPDNKVLLEKIVAKRDELARLLGFESYAALDLDDQMAKSPARVKDFLAGIIARSGAKEQIEFAQLTKELPESVTLSPDGKIYPWDRTFLTNWYKKKHYNIDNRKVAEYFPMEHTINGLLSIYQEFFSLEFKRQTVKGLWEDDLELIEVYPAGKAGNLQECIGYLVLDLYPRPNKYSHAAQYGVIPGLKNAQGRIIQPSCAVVMANFPKSTALKPSLMKREEVETFFHEFGHAIHTLLGATTLASFSGTRVKTDFVEMPSQMLEEWMWDRDMLRRVSRHYQTGEPLPEDMITKLLEIKNITSGAHTQRQAFFARYALELFGPGAVKDSDALRKKIAQEVLASTVFDDESHMQASFGHLIGYGSKYYGYLWSKVFALDLFETISAQGLLNPQAGSRYAQMVLGKGGSVDPNTILREYLGREPKQDAFFKNLGI